MANNWKRVKVDFSTVKLGDFIEPIKRIFSDLNDEKYATVYGVSNTDGICITGKESSKDISKYIILEDDCFAFNPYRINVGSIGINDKRLKGCVSPAYVVFKTNKKLNPYFLHYYLKSEYGNHLINWYGNRGGVRNALRYDDLCQIDIPNIDLPTQLVLLKDIQKYNAIYENLCYESANQSSYLTKFRQAILQEAIEGKLTADWRKENPVRKGDPDYDAEALLEKIQAEKEKLIKKGKIKEQKPLAHIEADELPFELPNGWAWCQLSQILANTKYALKAGPFGSSLTKSEYKKNGYKVYGQEQVISQDPFCGNYFIDNQKYEQLKSCAISPGDILISLVGTIGKILILPEDVKPGVINPRLIKITLHSSIFKNYFTMLYSSGCIQSQLKDNASGQTMDVISIKILSKVMFPLPPFAEQQAIVDRVEKLLSMVDELEKQISERKEQSKQLMQAVLREAFEGGN